MDEQEACWMNRTACRMSKINCRTNMIGCWMSCSWTSYTNTSVGGRADNRLQAKQESLQDEQDCLKEEQDRLQDLQKSWLLFIHTWSFADYGIQNSALTTEESVLSSHIKTSTDGLVITIFFERVGLCCLCVGIANSHDRRNAFHISKNGVDHLCYVEKFLTFYANDNVY